MEPDTQLTCCVCNQPFFRLAKEARRNAKRGRKIYCGNACSARDKPEVRANWNNPELIEKYLKPNWGSIQPRQLDEFSPFRYFVRKAREREKTARIGDPADIDAVYLKNLWDAQGGLCPYTRLPMILLPNTSCHYEGRGVPTQASLDRIDSARGYIQGNVEFVCLAVNYAKSVYPKEVMLDFFAKMRDNPS